MATVKKRVGRPSMVGERVDHILDAYARCLALYGVKGTTLQRVANEARMARGHLRHYVGNRDELRSRFEKRIVSRYGGRATMTMKQGAAGHRAEALVRQFFGRETVPNVDYAAIDALFAAAGRDDKLRKRMRDMYLGLESLVVKALAADHPGRDSAVYEHAAYQIVALAYGHWTFAEIGFPTERAAIALRLALDVIATVAGNRVAR